MKRQSDRPMRFFSIFLMLALASGCRAASATQDGSGLSAQAIATLNSLEQIDPHPLYVMHYAGAYTSAPLNQGPGKAADQVWACSLFAALGNPDGRLYGRNFDWEHAPALLLFTDPPDGYASVSMVNLAFLPGASQDFSQLTRQPLAKRRFLLSTPLMPIDGMNEYGLVVAMAAVPESVPSRDPFKPTIGSLRIMREVLDHARTTDEALAVMKGYNIDFTGGPPHPLPDRRTERAGAAGGVLSRENGHHIQRCPLAPGNQPPALHRQRRRRVPPLPAHERQTG